MSNKASRFKGTIKSGEYKEIVRSIKKMESNERSEAIDEITSLMQNEDYEMKLKSFKIISELSSSEAIPPIIDTLETIKFNEHDVKRLVDRDTGPSGAEEKFKDLIIDSLIKYRNPECIAMFMDLYEDQEDENKREIIVHILKNLTNLAIEEFELLFNEELERNKKVLIIKLLGRLGSDDAMNLIFKFYEDKNKDVKKEIINELKNFNSPKIVPLLIKALRDRNSNIVEIAAQNLVPYASSNKVINEITEEIKRGEDREREEIVKYLSSTCEENMVPILITSLKDNLTAIKLCAIEGLKKVKGNKFRKEIIDAFIENIETDDIKWDILTALEQLSPPEALPNLIRILDEEEEEDRKHAKHGEKSWECRKIIARILGNIGSPRAVPALIKALESKQYVNRLVKEHAWAILIESLANIGSYETVPYLLKSFLNDSEPLCTKAIHGLIKSGRNAIPALMEIYKDNPKSRKKILNIFGEISSDEPLTLITNALSDENDDIRAEAIVCLSKIKNYEKTDFLFKAIKDSSPKVREKSLEIFMEKSCETDIFIEALKDEEPCIREKACKILGKMGTEKAINSIRGMLDDSSSDVRETAKNILEKITVKS